MLSTLWRHALRRGLVEGGLSDRETAALTRRLTPGLGGYVLLVPLGLVRPLAAVAGYLVLAVFLLVPVRRRP